jgi:hypothetical protein
MFWETLILARRTIQRNPLRSFLTTLHRHRRGGVILKW